MIADRRRHDASAVTALDGPRPAVPPIESWNGAIGRMITRLWFEID
jgi:hypothetical protein